MKKIPISWSVHLELDDLALSQFLVDLADAGGRRLALTGQAMEQMLEHPELESELRRQMAHCGLELFDAHAPHRPGQNIGGVSSRQPGAVALQQQVIELAGRLGIRTLTMHIALPNTRDTDYRSALRQARRRVEAALKVLLPVASRCGVVIALENRCHPAATCRQLLQYMESFASPSLGICYDTGHAHILSCAGQAPQAKISPHILSAWAGAKIDDDADNCELVLPHLVTVNLHDNNGCEDQHLLPGHGTVNWRKLMQSFDKAPRLLSRQCKASPAEFSADPAVGLRYFFSFGLA